MLVAAENLKSILKQNEGEIVDVVVTVDETWQKR